MGKNNKGPTNVTEPKKKNCARTSMSRPLPTKSSTHLHSSCIMKMNRQIKNVPAKSRLKLFIMNRSSFFIRKKSGSRIGTFVHSYFMLLLCACLVFVSRHITVQS